MTAPPDDTTTDTSTIIAALQQKLDAAMLEKATLTEKLTERTAAPTERDTEYSERTAHQAATIDVLKAMSASPGDAQPVFDLITESAHELCNSDAAGLYDYDGALVHIRSVFGGMDPEKYGHYASNFPMSPKRGSIPCRAILDKQLVHVRDVHADTDLLPTVHELGIRSVLAIPLLRDGHAIGAFGINSREPGGFSDSQVALLQTFAEQAVIAITSAETYRALQTRTSDLQETLEYQTATSDVLKVISRSTFDLQPVLTMVAEIAVRLCLADQAAIYRCEGDSFQLVTNFGWPPEYEARQREVGRYRVRANSPGIPHQVIIKRRAVHIHDVTTVPEYPEVAIKLGKERTGLGVPLLREGEPVGVIVLARQRVEPFTDRQIDLVRTFADQAVIAIENTRLITEQREALEQQTATAEVLQVINANPGDLTPVFDAMLEKALTLCGADQGTLRTFDGELFHVAAISGGERSNVERVRQLGPIRSSEDSSFYGRLAHGERIVHIIDARETDTYRNDLASRERLATRGIRTWLAVALQREDVLLGALIIHRCEVQPFTDKQITLLQNFAAQAVIAMENARLINEQREALEQQTATAEVLGVINRSPGDLTPVFDIILEKAMTLCGVAFGMLDTWDSQRWEIVATRGLPPALAEYLTLDRDTRQTRPLFQQILETRRPAHRLDTRSGDAYRSGNASVQALADLGGARTFLVIPLLKDDTVTGTISVYRQEVRAFSGREIALLENFAAQAVIAMENARLINEQREALEQQTATAEVLQVINASPGNLAPVFDAMLEKAMRLCGAAFGLLYTYDGELFHTVAHRGVPVALAEFRSKHPPSARPGGSAAPLIETMRPVHILDMMEQEFYRAGDAINRATVDLGGARTTLTVPLFKDGALLGVISIYRQEVRAFSAKQIALLESFAAQAVIAIENARLLDEIRQRQEELRVTFENMGDGVAMFDDTQHLVAWNRKFQDILDVPDDIIARRQTFPEYIRYLAKRGEYGADADVEEQVRRVLETAGQMRVFERARPNGSVIEVRSNPVAGGGFVLIYADITERKRSEAEIRAARDAAEEASRTIEAAYRELKAAQANLIQAEKMASLGQLTAGIAHEIKNPLNFVNNFAELSVDLVGELKDAIAPAETALTDKQRAEVKEVSAMLTSNLEKITEHGKRADGIVKAMLEHSRGSSGERRVVDLNALIDEALNLAYHGARAQDQSFNVTLERDFAEGIAPIEVNPQDITRVFLNLFANGFYAVGRRAREGGDAGFVPTLKVTTRDTGDAVVIRVRDNGTGIPADIRDKLFQPFFTTKPTGEGTGLGLSITYDIVTQQHGGNIAVDSKVGEYSEFTIRLPRKP